MADENKYLYKFKSTVFVTLIVIVMVGAVMLVALPMGNEGAIDESVSKALRVVATIMAAILGTGGVNGGGE